jgi:hypothetical protein
MYNPANGFKPEGSHYSPEFIRKFLTAEARKNNEVVDLALKKYADIKAGNAAYDDEPFVIAASLFTGNNLYTSDLSLINHTHAAWPLVHADGSITTEIVRSVRPAQSRGNPGNVEGITAPWLAMGMTGSFEMEAAEMIHNHAKSTDKALVY